MRKGSTVEKVRIERLRDAIEQRLSELAPHPQASAHRLAAAMRYALLSPGKRLRPLLTLLTAWRLGAEELTAIDPACAVEMVHAASLILDDLPCMDDAPARRGAPATHVRFGEEIALLAAVGLLNQAFAVLADAPALSSNTKLQMVRALTAAVGFDGLVAGQEHDLRPEGVVSVDGLSDLHQRKTAVLFLAAVQLGALAASAPDIEIAALTRFATEFGLAFQAADDVADGLNGQDAGRTNLSSLLGTEGARREAALRLIAAKSALEGGGATLAGLGPYVDMLLQVA